jgi:hypothetical protein
MAPRAAAPAAIWAHGNIAMRLFEKYAGISFDPNAAATAGSRSMTSAQT